MELKAIKHTLTGFNDKPYYEDEVTIVEFVYGKHQDAGGYGVLGECTLAVHILKSGKISSDPIHWFEIIK